MGAKKLKYYAEVGGQIVKVLNVVKNYYGTSTAKVQLVQGGPTSKIDTKYLKKLENQQAPEVLYGNKPKK